MIKCIKLKQGSAFAKLNPSCGVFLQDHPRLADWWMNTGLFGASEGSPIKTTAGREGVIDRWIYIDIIYLKGELV